MAYIVIVMKMKTSYEIVYFTTEVLHYNNFCSRMFYV